MAAVPPPAPAVEAGLLDRAQAFVAENKRAVLLGAAALAAGAGLALYMSSAPAGGSRKGGARKKDGKKDKKRRDDAPLLEQRGGADDDDVALTDAELVAMNADERAAAAASLKARGNAAYQQRSFERAAELYTRAIAASPLPEPVFYSNRAACYVNMSPPQHALVVADCDVALSLDKAYVKALNRRAAAHEALENLPEALRDFTACTILDKFQNAGTAAAVERVLKKLAQATAARTLADRAPRLPSYTFVSAYFAAFRPQPRPAVPEDGAAVGDGTLLLALDALDAADYPHALSLVGEAVEQGLSSAALRARALNLRGTFKFLLADVPGAQADLEASLALDPALTQSWVKIASVHMERGEPQAAFEAFEAAIARDAADPDIYYHRGQVLFIMNAFGDAAADYAKSTELDPNFVFSHIQLAVAQYKAEQLGKAMATFRAALRSFPARSEPANYYGELLLDQGRFEEAVEKFERAVELESANPRQNVLPLVNKGLALFQWKQDVGAAEAACRAALAVDTECEAAVATLAQLALQQGHVAEAVDLFARQAELARSEPELVNALTYQFAASAQLQFAAEYPEKASEMSALARSMM